MYLSSWLMGWTAGAVLLVEAFAPSLFCFPLPYSFSAVYGCTLGCIFLYVVIRASDSRGWGWIFWAGLLAGIGGLMKPGFGLACSVTLWSLLCGRCLQAQSSQPLATDA